jgi:hypothetical protein
VQRGRIVNRVVGKPENQLPERHAASDIDAVLATARQVKDRQAKDGDKP